MYVKRFFEDEMKGLYGYYQQYTEPFYTCFAVFCEEQMPNQPYSTLSSNARIELEANFYSLTNAEWNRLDDLATQRQNEHYEIRKEKKRLFKKEQHRKNHAVKAALCLMWCAKQGVLSRDTMSIIAKMVYQSRGSNIWDLINVENQIRLFQDKLIRERERLKCESE